MAARKRGSLVVVQERWPERRSLGDHDGLTLHEGKRARDAKRGGALERVSQFLILLIAFALIARLHLAVVYEINWDEFLHLSLIYEHARGELTRALQTAYVHLFHWLPWVASAEIDQIVAARIAIFGLTLGTATFLFLIALSAHGTDVSYPLRGGLRGRLYGFYLRLGARLLRRCVVIANSRATCDCARSHGFSHVVVSPLATDMRPADPLPEVEPFVLFAGRLVEGTGCGWFIRHALPELPENLRLKVAGTVWSNAEGAALEHPRVEFVGPKGPLEIADLYARATCVVAPKIEVPNGEFEGFGLVAIEASAAGVVVVAAAHSGLRDAVIDGVTGFLLPSGNQKAWIAKITEIGQWRPGTRRTVKKARGARVGRLGRMPKHATDRTRASNEISVR